jgi:hypothetical protein
MIIAQCTKRNTPVVSELSVSVLSVVEVSSSPSVQYYQLDTAVEGLSEPTKHTSGIRISVNLRIGRYIGAI